MKLFGKVTYNIDGLTYTANILASHEVKKCPYLIYNLLVLGSVILVLAIFKMLAKK